MTRRSWALGTARGLVQAPEPERGDSPDGAAGAVSWPPVPLTDEAAGLEWARGVHPGAFFSKGGLAAQELARAVLAMGPLARGIDRRIWVYRHGVYVPDNDIVGARVTDLSKTPTGPRTPPWPSTWRWRTPR